MIQSFEDIKDNLTTELRAKLLDSKIWVKYYQGEVVTYKKMTKDQATEALIQWTKNMVSAEDKLKRYQEYDVKDLKDYE